MKFNEDYTEYWMGAVKKSIDGSLIPGSEVADSFLKYLDIEKNHKILDLGCSFGRMFDVLSKFSDEVYGLDADPFAINEASKHSYKVLVQGYSEEIFFDDDFFDHIFVWATFDAVGQNKTLCELNRVLKNSGKFLLTGKNDKYFEDDLLAFAAEKAAFLKKFPNKFSNLKKILSNAELFGFEIEYIFIFDKRGDFGLNKFRECPIDENLDYVGYEYLLVGRKIRSILPTEELMGILLSNPTSQNVQELVAKFHYKEIEEVFNSSENLD
jgi:SAM-dependent methyltransferase